MRNQNYPLYPATFESTLPIAYGGGLPRWRRVHAERGRDYSCSSSLQIALSSAVKQSYDGLKRKPAYALPPPSPIMNIFRNMA